MQPRCLGALLILAAAGGGCAKAGEGPSEPGAATLRVGIEAKYPPFESLKGPGEFEGFDIDLARELGRALGRPVKFEDLDWDSLIPSLQTDRIDLVCSGMSWTEERTKLIDFSAPYAQSPMSVLVNTELAKDVTKPSQLDNESVTFAVQRGTTGATKAKDTFKKAHFVEFGTENEAAATVGTGRNHAFVYDFLSVAKYARQYPQTTRVLDESLGAENYCMAVKKGSPLRAEIDRFLADAKKEGGVIERLMDRWLPGAREKLKAR
jgi:polar amino acid transport system substrate-binding protein